METPAAFFFFFLTPELHELEKSKTGPLAISTSGRDKLNFQTHVEVGRAPFLEPELNLSFECQARMSLSS